MNNQTIASGSTLRGSTSAAQIHNEGQKQLFCDKPACSPKANHACSISTITLFQLCKRPRYTTSSLQRAAAAHSKSNYSTELSCPETSRLINLDCMHLPGKIFKASRSCCPLSHICRGLTCVVCLSCLMETQQERQYESQKGKKIEWTNRYM